VVVTLVQQTVEQAGLEGFYLEALTTHQGLPTQFLLAEVETYRLLAAQTQAFRVAIFLLLPLLVVVEVA
jgi:hypothetical protein